MLRVNPAGYIPIPTMLVTYGNGMEFAVYMRKNRSFMLFARPGELTEAHKLRLRDNQVDTLYIHSDDVASFDEYMETNFSTILDNDGIPLEDRSEMLYGYSIGLGKILMVSEGRIHPTPQHRQQLELLFGSTFDYLSRKKGAAKSIAGMISHNHRTYAHCVNVAMYVMLVLVALGSDKRRAKLIGTGCALHDIGKTKVPKAILNKPGHLTERERLIINRHPADGLDICRDMDLDDLSKDCIIHHHEKLDGSGYPSGARRVPEHVRLVSVADIYDALTSDRPYAKAYNTFRALKIITHEAEIGRLDNVLCREFITILSEGQLVPG